LCVVVDALGGYLESWLICEMAGTCIYSLQRSRNRVSIEP